MNLNPLSLLDSILADYASAKVRRTVHTLILLVAALVTIWLSVEGEWREMLVSLAALLYAGANKANTPASEEDEYEDGYEDGVEDAETYEEAGGQPYPRPAFNDEDSFGNNPARWAGDPHRP